MGHHSWMIQHHVCCTCLSLILAAPREGYMKKMLRLLVYLKAYITFSTHIDLQQRNIAMAKEILVNWHEQY